MEKLRLPSNAKNATAICVACSVCQLHGLGSIPRTSLDRIEKWGSNASHDCHKNTGSDIKCQPTLYLEKQTF